MPSSLNVLPLKVLFCSKVFMKILWIDQSRWNIDLSVYGNIFNLLKMQWYAKKRLHVDTNCFGEKRTWSEILGKQANLVRYYAGTLINVESAY